MRVRAVKLRQRAQFIAWEPVKAHVRRHLKKRQLRPVVIKPGLRSARLVAVIPVKNEAARMPALLSHYRNLGVEHFVVIDNESTDGLRTDLEPSEDVSVYEARGSYASARYGVDWVNAVLTRHCHDKWVVHVDADEYLVFDSKLRDLRDVCDWLDGMRRRSLQSLMLDMYSDKRASDNIVVRGQNPLEVCNFFDAHGYERHLDWPSATTWIKGGVRGRLFFPDRWEGPALNKTPLVRWRRHYAYLRAAHLVWPRSLNGGFRTPESALLHFKFISSATALMVDDAYRAQHTAEYMAYDNVGVVTMTGRETRRYSAPQDLTAAGLLTKIGWVI